MDSRLRLLVIASRLLSIPFLATIAQAQITPDGTLNTAVTQSGLNTTITNGTSAGTNLYHSFRQFSVPTGGSATFDLNATPAIRTIFSRVTGGSVSNIDGLIRTLNSSNPVSLFLMNPAGIIFGANASLNIGGSFVATTANSIKFVDGSEFSAINAQATPLLSLNVPLGLQMGSNAAAITVQGTGRNTILDGVAPVAGLTGSTGLQVPPDRTLALVGGNIALEGGVLAAPGGRIELGSVIGGSVTLTAIPQGFSLSYLGATSFGNLSMTQRALVSTRGTSPGSVQIQGKQVSLRDGSLVAVQNLGGQNAGNITVNATDSVDVIGMSPDFASSSGLINETVALGAGGNIAITTPKLTIDQGAIVLSRTYSAATSGNVAVNAGSIFVGGIAPGNPSANPIFSVLLAATYGSGQGGSLSIATQNLAIAGGGNVGTRNFSRGNGGNVTVKADTVEVSSATTGTNPTLVSLLSANAFGAGNAGNLQLDTRTLSIQAGGVVSVSTVSTGNAGNLTINVSEAIDVNGTKDAQNPSYIGAVARTFVRTFVEASQNSTANAGSITISTPVFTIRNGATVFVANDVQGNAGSVTIKADRLQLDNGGSISASTKVGEGGNINLQLSKGLILRHGSFITATAGGTGDGGNITINAPIIAGFENSDIIANAVRGRGGNIQITTQGIFGLKFRPKLTPGNDITASSQFGVSGNVQINNLGFDPTSGVVDLPVSLVDPSQQIATGCNAQGSRFVATGRGGLPPNPNEQVRSDRPWNDIRDVSQFQQPGQPIAHIVPRNPLIIEATELKRNPNGTIELIATLDANPSNFSAQITCANAIAR